MDREELIRKYGGGKWDFTGKKIQAHWNDRIDKGIIYQQADFSNSYFELSGFDECDLSFTKFLYARMYERGFFRSYMPGADFTYATFSQCRFTDVDFRAAIFKNTTISETRFKRCNLAYADFTGARELRLRPFEECLIYETIMPDGSICTDDI